MIPSGRFIPEDEEKQLELIPMPKWIRDGRVYSSPPHHFESDFGPSETRTAGVMTMRNQIDRLKAAGTVQSAWRNAHFPPEESIPDDFIPPGYNPTELELIDEAKRVLNGKAANRAQARKQVAEAKVEAESASTESDDTPPDEAA
jgi:hypothetical protein